MTATAHRPTYFLSKDCYVCRTQGYWIILSLGRDEYFCIAHHDVALIADRLDGWLGASRKIEYERREEAEATIASLLHRKILTDNPMRGKSFAASAFPPAQIAIDPSRQLVPKRLPLRCIAKFLWACGKTDWRLRTKVLSRTLDRIERRRLLAQRSTDNWNVPLAEQLIANFKALRPLYPRPYLCLFESLALLEFLASYRLVPQIFFGVVAEPFHAHCWLQYGSTVLDENLEILRRYSPILRV